MSGIDYEGISDKIVTHLSANLDADIYYVTNRYSVGILGTKKISVLVKFAGFSSNESLSQVPDAPTRDANYVIIFIVQGEDDEACDTLVNRAIKECEFYLNFPEHGAPIYDSTLVEWARVDAARKGEVPKYKGTYGYLVLTDRIMEA
jgi:hypothetical protein